ncbi:hypothetical protein [Mycoplasmoides pirum]|uniref:hypothetical protein n=1 Tax=Mycoplasmoides pirum TaxID=2122 RepID=UPI0006977D68|nr:hypothetical protein [Mycoplasmoides pirum]
MKNKLTIIYNSYLNSSKIKNQLNLIKKASDYLKTNVYFIPTNKLEVLINTNKSFFLPSKKILFLEKNIPVAKYLEKQNYHLYNNSYSINVCDNKALTHIELIKEKSIKQPKTLIGPVTFNLNGSNKAISDFLTNVKNNFKFPLIIKEVYGSFGEQVYLINNLKEFKNKFLELKNKQIIVQEFYKSFSGQSLRILVINNKIISCIKQVNLNDFRSNLSQNSKAEIFNKLLPKNFEKSIDLITKKLKLFYGGIDFIFDKNKKLVFCEANSNVQLANISQIFNKNFAIDLINEILKDKKYYEKK